MSLYWNPPADNGCLPILRYRVAAYNNTGNFDYVATNLNAQPGLIKDINGNLTILPGIKVNLKSAAVNALG